MTNRMDLDEAARAMAGQRQMEGSEDLPGRRPGERADRQEQAADSPAEAHEAARHFGLRLPSVASSA